MIIIKALSDENRLRILKIIGDRTMCAKEILSELEISQPTLSHHMSVLKEARIVKTEKTNRNILYSINREVMFITSEYIRSIGAHSIFEAAAE